MRSGRCSALGKTLEREAGTGPDCVTEAPRVGYLRLRNEFAST